YQVPSCHAKVARGGGHELLQRGGLAGHVALERALGVAGTLVAHPDDHHDAEDHGQACDEPDDDRTRRGWAGPRTYRRVSAYLPLDPVCQMRRPSWTTNGRRTRNIFRMGGNAYGPSADLFGG